MNMKHLVALVGMSILVGCAGSPSATDLAKDQLKAEQTIADAKQAKAAAALIELPDWVLNPPKNDLGGVYAVGIGESNTLRNAMKKAELDAMYELAKSLSQEIAGNEQSYSQDRASGGSVEQYTRLVDSIVDAVPLRGYSLVEQKVTPIDGTFTSYKLMRITYDDLQSALSHEKNKVVSEEAKQAFTELEARLAKRKADANSSGKYSLR